MWGNKYVLWLRGPGGKPPLWMAQQGRVRGAGEGGEAIDSRGRFTVILPHHQHHNDTVWTAHVID